jgi:RNA polymerase sigma factor (sigma-70 family)
MVPGRALLLPFSQNKGDVAMASANVGSTSPELLGRVAALCDNPAWRQFFELYGPLVKTYCSAYRLDGASVDELCQRVWVELVRRMPSYQYDPGGSFRGWLRRLCHHRAIDLYRERCDRSFLSLWEGDSSVGPRARMTGIDRAAGNDEVDQARLLLLQEAQAAQEEVRRKVKPVRWEAFWRTVIQGEPMQEVAHALGLKYATAYAGANHVAQLLRAEGRRRRDRLGVMGSLTWGGE